MKIALKSSLLFVVLFLIGLGTQADLQSKTSSVSVVDCNYYNYDLGFNHAKNVRRNCSYSASVLQNTYTLNMSNPCSLYRVGFQEAWFAYAGACSVGGGSTGGGNGGGGNGGGPSGPDPGGNQQ